MRALRTGFKALRLAIPLLYLIEAGILLPLHVHETANPVPGAVLAARCHAAMPCADPEHQHPPAPDDHKDACVACVVALRPALAPIHAPAADPTPDDCPLHVSPLAIPLSRAPRSASARAPPALLPA
jgi:hypothetical protein